MFTTVLCDSCVEFMCLLPHAAPTYPSVTRVVSSFSFPPPTVGNGVVSAYSLSDITAAIIVGMVSGALAINA